jgi:hypothetical protein
MAFFHVSRAMAMATAAVLVLGAVPAAGQELGRAVEGSYITNLAMLSEAAESALNELFLGFSGPEGATLRVEAAQDHEANWFIENLILTRLSDAGYSAYLKEAPQVGPPVPPQFRDSTATGEGDEESAGVAKEASPDLILRYRVAEFGIRYPETHRKSPLGSRRVQRLAAVSVFANLLKGKREDVVWVGRGDAERMDVVPAGKLPLLEGKTFPFSKPFLAPGGLGSLVEPALVTGIVVGLIYLFYTNQN